MSHTLARRAWHRVEIRHSAFLAQAAPVESPQAALEFLAEVADAQATHNCWAYRIGASYRSSDDGEPSGTAGRPILAAIDGLDFDQVMVVVTRWYGGTKLGAGGLARAYGGTASECLRGGERRELLAMVDVELACPFEDIASAHAALAAAGGEKLEESFDSHGARMRLRVPIDRLDALKTRLRDATRNRVRLSEALPR